MKVILFPSGEKTQALLPHSTTKEFVVVPRLCEMVRFVGINELFQVIRVIHFADDPDQIQCNIRLVVDP